jgi:TRAP-type C4-dicarboxylate transport system permease large subunit
MALLIGSFIGLMLVGVPVAIAMAVASVLYLLVFDVAPDVIVAQRMIAGVESFPLLAVPFFILAGNLMNIAGVTGRIYSFAVALVGWMKGGLAQVNIIGSVIFSGMSGTALADAAGIGTIEIKAMKDHGYPVEVAVGVTAASATLGPIFPPSLPFVIYGMMSNVSIGALFLAGVVPGIVMTVLMMGTVAVFAYRRGWGSDTPFAWRKLAAASVEILVVLAFPALVYALVWAGLSLNVAVGIALVALVAVDWWFDFSAVMALMTPVILIGGMTLGWFTPTEAAVAAVIWSLFLGLVRYRSMTLTTLAKASFDTIETTASVLFIVTAASIFAWLLTVSQAAQLLSDAILGLTDNKWVFLILVNLLVLFIGCFLDTIAAITILVPILLPIVLKLGIDPIHFGLILTLNLMIGLLHPPLGMVLFVLSRVAKLSVERTTMAILPWLVPLFLALLAITFIPEITLWLPRAVGMVKGAPP